MADAFCVLSHAIFRLSIRGRFRKRKKLYVKPRSTRVKQLEALQFCKGWCPSEACLNLASGEGRQKLQIKAGLGFI